MTTSEKRRTWSGEGASAFETIFGSGTAILAVIGLAHMSEHYMFSLAGIVLGAAFLVNGCSMVIAKHVPRIGGSPYAEFGAESAAGIAAIVLCLIAMSGVVALALTSAAVIVLGVGLSLSSSGVASRLRVERNPGAMVAGPREKAVSASLSAASYLQAAIGSGALILGIMAMSGFHPAVLDPVALLVMGISRCA